MHFIFCHCITISFPPEKIPINFVFPGTIILVIVPVSKSAHTSWTYPNFLPSFIFITSYCLKSIPFWLIFLSLHINSLYIICSFSIMICLFLFYFLISDTLCQIQLFFLYKNKEYNKCTPYLYNRFIWFIAFFSNLDTWACDIPISSATSICVLPSKNLFPIIIFSFSFNFFIASIIVIVSAQ